jgi:transposase
MIGYHVGKKKNEAPKQVKLTAEQVKELQERLQKNQLTKDDADLLQGVLSFTLWLQDRLSRAKLSIKRLRKLFGFKTESRKKSKQDNDNSDESSTTEPTEEDAANNSEATVAQPPAADDQQTENHLMPQWDDSKNHGRLGANDYSGCEEVDVNFTDEYLLTSQCPDCAKHHNTDAKVYPVDPSVIVVLEGTPLVCGTRYHLQKTRCSVCLQYFTAPLPKAVKGKPKYAPSAKTNIAVHHYYGGLPFKRIEMMQAANQVPLPDATQFDLMNELYQSAIKPVAGALRLHGANGEILYFDDTGARILEQIQVNKVASSAKAKKAVHGTAIVSIYEGHRIYLFDTNTHVSGKVLRSLLDDRTVDEDFTSMSDASASNFPILEDSLAARWVISLCLSHGRRHFVELVGDEDKDIHFILDVIGRVYEHERYCKQQQHDPDQRLAYHQVHSSPLIESLRIWLNNLLLYKSVEPNSRLGEAIGYMLKRWFWLTQFLRVAGAPLDNNLCEQTIKVMIRYRKNSLFYRTFYGATIGDAMMSVMHTAVHAGANLFHYINSLQEYVHHVELMPQQWLPWNYEQTMANLTEVSKQAQAA